MNSITQVCATIALALALSPTVIANPPADKGKGLSGDKRRKFINDCLDKPNRY